MAPYAPKSSSNTPNRWAGIVRPYSEADVLRLRGSLKVECARA